MYFVLIHLLYINIYVPVQYMYNVFYINNKFIIF